MKRRSLVSIAVLGLLLGLMSPVTADHDPANGPEVPPDLESGNPACPEGTSEIKFEGTTLFSSSRLSTDVDGETVTVHLISVSTASGGSVTFEVINGLAQEVIVKGGNKANVYDYSGFPGGGIAHDDGLTAPTNPKSGTTFGISHISFCVVELPDFGALQILKNSTKGGAVSTAGAVFSYDSASVTDNGAGDEDLDIGEVCVSGLTPGTYTVNETSPPPGYGAAPASEADQMVTVVGDTDCTANLPGAGATATFSNPPLSDIQVRFRDGGSGETMLTVPLDCDNTTGTSSTTDTTGWDDTLTITGIEAPTTITCTIVIDP